MFYFSGVKLDVLKSKGQLTSSEDRENDYSFDDWFDKDVREGFDDVMYLF